jgi:phosphonatase-like hydrolase
MSISLVVFDIAGTTVADNGKVNKAFYDAFINNRYTISPVDIDKVMGYRKTDAIRMILSNFDLSPEAEKDIVEIIHDDFTRNMVEYYRHDEGLKPLPFAEETFYILRDKGIKVALNTGFTRKITDTVLQRLQWQNNLLINAVICSDEVPEGRPYPFMIQDLMKSLNVHSASEVVKVGDTEVDILEGRNAGCKKVIAVSTGAYSKEELTLCNPDHVIDTLEQLPALIL